jgi:hypothetical protein
MLMGRFSNPPPLFSQLTDVVAALAAVILAGHGHRSQQLAWRKKGWLAISNSKNYYIFLSYNPNGYLFLFL